MCGVTALAATLIEQKMKGPSGRGLDLDASDGYAEASDLRGARGLSRSFFGCKSGRNGWERPERCGSCGR